MPTMQPKLLLRDLAVLAARAVLVWIEAHLAATAAGAEPPPALLTKP